MIKIEHPEDVNSARFGLYGSITFCCIALYGLINTYLFFPSSSDLTIIKGKPESVITYPGSMGAGSGPYVIIKINGDSFRHNSCEKSLINSLKKSEHLSILAGEKGGLRDFRKVYEIMNQSNVLVSYSDVKKENNSDGIIFIIGIMLCIIGIIYFFYWMRKNQQLTRRSS